MSIVVMIWAASLLEGISETTKIWANKIKDYADRQRFKRKLRAKRKGRREFV